VLLIGPLGVGKSHQVQAIGQEVLKAGFLVLNRSIFDLVRELLTQESQASEGRLLNKYLKPDPLIIDHMGLKILPPKSGEILLEIIMRRHVSRSTMVTSNRPIAEWGKLLKGRARRQRHPRPFAPSSRDHSDQRAKLPTSGKNQTTPPRAQQLNFAFNRCSLPSVKRKIPHPLRGPLPNFSQTFYYGVRFSFDNHCLVLN
jgi:hypothetical protein